jgi:hypothetical protein
VSAVKFLCLVHPDNIEIIDSQLTRSAPFTLPADVPPPASAKRAVLLLGALAAARDTVVLVEQGVFWHRTGQMTNLTLLSCLLLGLVATLGWLDRLAGWNTARAERHAPVGEHQLEDRPGVQKAFSFVRLENLRS